MAQRKIITALGCRHVNEDILFDEFVLSIEHTCFGGRLPQIRVASLVTIIVTAALTAIPCVTEAAPHVKEWFAGKLSLAVARRLAAAERPAWEN